MTSRPLPRTPVVVIADHPSPSLDIERELLAGIHAEIRVAAAGQELAELTGDAHAVLTCFAQVPAEVVAGAVDLRVVGRYGVGVDNIAVATATERGVPVTNVPVYCQDEVAEHVLALLFALARRLPVYDASVRSGEWDIARGMPMFRIAGKTLGLVGFGHIARTLCERARALGLEVLAADPWVPDEDVIAAGARPASLERLLAESDFVSLHTPLTDDTRGLLNDARLATMKPTAFLINASRGPVVDLAALERALRSGQIAGAGLDVFDPEVLPADHPLLGLPTLLATPHVAFYSEESMLELRRQAVTNVVDVLSGRRPRAVVNPIVYGDAPQGAR
jgi:D-3-phosphoglycerate dehydrogenase